MKDNVIVISHRRSGTHLTVDGIINNFAVFGNSTDVSDFTIDHIFNGKNLEASVNIDRFLNSIKDKPKVLKTHSINDIDSYFFSLDKKSFKKLSKLFRKAKKIYIYRGGMDVMVSLYFYQQQYLPSLKKTSFSEFLRQPNNLDCSCFPDNLSRPEFWAKHLDGWIKSKDVMLLKFDDLRFNPAQSISNISEFIGVPHYKRLKDVSLEPSAGINDKIGDDRMKRTSISFRRGNVGDWKEYFTEDDISYFKQEVKKVSEDLLAYIK